MRQLGILFLLAFCALLHAEDLKPRSQVKKTPEDESAPAVEETAAPTEEAPSEVQPVTQPSKRKSIHQWGNSRIALGLGTVLGSENFYDKRFSTIVFGGEYLFPLTALTRRIQLYGDLGFLFSLSRLTLTQPATSFSHYYLFFPIEVSARMAINRQFLVEAFAGVLLRPWELDSRSTYDGGFHAIRGVSVFSPEIGAGVLFALSHSTYGHIRVSYQFLRLGIELVL